MNESNVAVIVGASRGIGLALAREFLLHGWRVCALARDPGVSSLKTLGGEYPDTLTRYHADVLHQETLDTASRAVARDNPRGVDILVNNAGVLPTRRHVAVESYDPDEMSETFDVNTTGVMRSCHSFAPVMAEPGAAPETEKESPDRADDGGLAGTVPRARIVNITSIMGSLAEVDSPRNYAYSVSKAALNMLTRILHREFLPRRIGVLALHPGWVRTRMGGDQAPLARHGRAQCQGLAAAARTKIADRLAGPGVGQQGQKLRALVLDLD